MPPGGGLRMAASPRYLVTSAHHPAARSEPRGGNMYYLVNILLISINVLFIVLLQVGAVETWWLNLFTIGFITGLTVAKFIADAIRRRV